MNIDEYEHEESKTQDFDDVISRMEKMEIEDKTISTVGKKTLGLLLRAISKESIYNAYSPSSRIFQRFCQLSNS